MKILKALKYYPLVALGKNVTNEWESAHQEDRPFYLSRRFTGAALMLIAGFLGIHYGVKIDETLINQISDNLQTAITAAVTVWGLIIEVVGIVKREKKQ